MQTLSRIIPLTAAMLLAALPLVAQDETATAGPSVPEPVSFETHHEGTFNGVSVVYTARAGETYLNDEEGEPKASFFTFAYTKDGEVDPATRPVTFIWNGGPGSASMWLHMGTFGPVKISVPSDAEDAGAPPYPLEANTLTLLDISDLVFVDPVGTGYSRPLGTHEGEEFWGLYEDANSVAEFIQKWITDHGRWNSPKFLIGESFGTTRAAAVADILEGQASMSLNGIVLISQALDYAGSTPIDNNLISYFTYLPTMAATAWYHGKVDPRPSDLASFVEEARQFVVNEYIPALIMGTRLDDTRRAEIRDRLAWFTGLDPEYVERANLRVTGSRFVKELLRDQGLGLGRLDARYTRDDIDDNGSGVEGDAASQAISSAFVTAINSYMREDLDVVMDRPYLPSGGRGMSGWNWDPRARGSSGEPMWVNTTPDLARALRRNSDLRVLVASGYYDMITPFYDAEWTFARHGILPDRIDFTYYEAGHMMYVHGPSYSRFMADVRTFMQKALSGRPTA